MRSDTMGRKKRTPVEPIADALRAEIKRRELTAYRLAKMTGSSVDSIQGFISGTKGLTLKTIERLMMALDLVVVPREETGK
jgi:plasmid maintenance system antidote protein VapI